jgi:hypothetical protein
VSLRELAKGAEDFAAFRLRSNRVRRDEGDAAVDGVGDERVAKEEELLVVAKGKVVQSAATVAPDDLARANLGESSFT